MLREFDQKTAYIIGGSSGIGLCTAKLLAGKGAHVVIFARGLERLERATAEIQKESPGDRIIACKVMDVSFPDEVEIILSRSVAEYGAPDLLVNCAGRAIPRRFEEVSYAQFDETMKLNIYGIRHAVSALLPYMKERGGAIVNVSSVAGLIGVFGYTDYCASKFAVIGFSEALRSELKPYGLTVSVLCPPDTDTPALEAENATKPEETKAISGNAGIMQPEDVARALIDGVRRGRFLIIPGFESKSTWLAKRLVPGLVNWIMDRTIRKVQSKSPM